MSTNRPVWLPGRGRCTVNLVRGSSNRSRNVARVLPSARNCLSASVRSSRASPNGCVEDQLAAHAGRRRVNVLQAPAAVPFRLDQLHFHGNRERSGPSLAKSRSPSRPSPTSRDAASLTRPKKRRLPAGVSAANCAAGTGDLARTAIVRPVPQSGGLLQVLRDEEQACLCGPEIPRIVPAAAGHQTQLTVPM